MRAPVGPVDSVTRGLPGVFPFCLPYPPQALEGGVAFRGVEGASEGLTASCEVGGRVARDAYVPFYS